MSDTTRKMVRPDTQSQLVAELTETRSKLRALVDAAKEVEFIDDRTDDFDVRHSALVTARKAAEVVLGVFLILIVPSFLLF